MPGTKRKAPNRPTKLRCWSNESMLHMFEAVKAGKLDLIERHWSMGVPRTTLKDRIAGRVIHGTNIGPNPY